MKQTKKRIENNNFFYDNFKKSISYTRKIKNYIYFAVILFILSGVIGILYHPTFLIDPITSMIKELIEKTDNLSPVELTGFIIFNNTKTSFSGFIFGIFFSFIPIFITIVNGYLLGFVAYTSIADAGIFVLWRLLPHGVFELPAVLISLGLGIKLGCFMFTRNKEKGFLAFFITLIATMFIFFAFYIVLILFLFFINFDSSLVFDPNLFETEIENLLDNSSISLLLLTLFFISFFISLLLGMRVFSKKERKKIFENLKYDFVNCFRTFVFIVVPLLLIAGIIEGVLIYFLDRFSENLVEVFLSIIYV